MKEQYIQLCCEFYNEHSPEDKIWFGRMYDECHQEHNKRNSSMYRWQFPLMVLKSQQGRIKELEQWNQNQYNLINELQNKIEDAELQIAVHWGADEDTDSVLKDIEKVFSQALKPSVNKTDIADCSHFSTTMFHDGKAECFQCGAVVNHERKVIGVKR